MESRGCRARRGSLLVSGVGGKLPGSPGSGRKPGGKLRELVGTLAVGGRAGAGSPMTRPGDHTAPRAHVAASIHALTKPERQPIRWEPF